MQLVSGICRVSVISSDMCSSDKFMGLLSGMSLSNIFSIWICNKIGEFVLVVSSMICLYGRLLEGSPEAELAPAHAEVPVPRGCVVGAEDELRVHPGGPGGPELAPMSGGRVLAPMAWGAMVTESENPCGPSSQQQLSMSCYSEAVSRGLVWLGGPRGPSSFLETWLSETAGEKREGV